MNEDIRFVCCRIDTGTVMDAGIEENIVSDSELSPLFITSAKKLKQLWKTSGTADLAGACSVRIKLGAFLNLVRCLFVFNYLSF